MDKPKQTDTGLGKGWGGFQLQAGRRTWWVGSTREAWQPLTVLAGEWSPGGKHLVVDRPKREWVFGSLQGSSQRPALILGHLDGCPVEVEL